MSQSQSNNGQSNSQTREVALRVFAEELQQLRHMYKDGEGDYAPNYALLPSGVRGNRVFFIGTLMDMEDIGNDDDEYWRATINDSTGNFLAYAGQFQSEVVAKLKEIDTPEFVAVTGKIQSYETDDGDLVPQIRPEDITVASQQDRDRWVLEAAEQTLDRLESEPDEEIAEMLEEHYEDDLEEVQDKVREACVRAIEEFESDE